MNEYIFYTTEGHTNAPNDSVEVENCQMLGMAHGSNREEAMDNLLQENEWIEYAGFSCDKIICKQLITKKQISDIKTVIDYLWADEERHYEKCLGADEIKDAKYHVFHYLKHLKAMVNEFTN